MIARILSPLLVLSFTPFAFAGLGSDHIFLCKVFGFDQKEVVGQCDPSRPKAMMKIPRDWIDAEEVVKVNRRIKFILDEKQYGQWLVMNDIEVPKRKSK